MKQSFSVFSAIAIAALGGYLLGHVSTSCSEPERPGLGPKQNSLYDEIGVFSTDADIRAYLNRRYDFQVGAFPFSLTDTFNYAYQETRDVESVTVTVGQIPRATPVTYTFYRRLDALVRERLTSEEYVKWMIFVLRTGASALYLSALEGSEALYDANQKTHDCVLIALAENRSESISQECVPILRQTLSKEIGVTLVDRQALRNAEKRDQEVPGSIVEDQRQRSSPN
jgi:hypothetical protein